MHSPHWSQLQIMGDDSKNSAQKVHAAVIWHRWSGQGTLPRPSLQYLQNCPSWSSLTAQKRGRKVEDGEPLPFSRSLSSEQVFVESEPLIGVKNLAFRVSLFAWPAEEREQLCERSKMGFIQFHRIIIIICSSHGNFCLWNTWKLLVKTCTMPLRNSKRWMKVISFNCNFTQESKAQERNYIWKLP